MSVLVSIIMPAKNAGDFISKSIESILNQSYKNIELIVVNDRSTDNTLSVIGVFNDQRLKVVEGIGKGIANAFNLGLKAAKGQYLCRCDADDLYPSTRIEEQVKWLEMHPENIAVCGSFSSIDLKGRPLVQFNRDDVSMSLDAKFFNGILTTHFCTFMSRTDALRQLNGCRSFFITAEDIDLQFRLSEKGSIYYIAKSFYLYRLHDASITHSQPNNQRIFFEEKAKFFHEQRKLNGYDDLMEGLTPDISIGFDKPSDSESHITGHLISESWYWHRKNKKWNAICVALKAIRLYPFNFKIWRNLILILIKYPFKT